MKQIRPKSATTWGKQFNIHIKIIPPKILSLVTEVFCRQMIVEASFRSVSPIKYKKENHFKVNIISLMLAHM